MSAAYAGTSLSAYSIDFIDEHDTRRILFGLVEEVTNTGCTHAHEHFYEVGAGYGEERHSRLSCRCLGNVSFSCSRRAYEKYSLRDSGSKFLVFARVLEEVDDFFKLLLFFLQTCYIIKGNLLFSALHHLGSGFGELERLAVSALVHHYIEQENQSTYHYYIRKQTDPE